MQQNLIDAARAVIAADRAGELTDEHILALEAAANVPDVQMMQVYRAQLKTRAQMKRDIPEGQRGWWYDVAHGEILTLRQATQADLDRCTLNDACSRSPSDYMCETFDRGSLVSKAAIAHINPEQHTFAAIAAKQHPDDVAVDRFALAMKAKLAAAPSPAQVDQSPVGTFAQLRAANVLRQKEWDTGSEKVSLAFRGNELAGEVGELCNVLKKLERERIGIVGSRATPAQAAEELADVVICADLIALDLGVDLGAATRDKFNATSAKYGLSTTMPTAGNLPAGDHPQIVEQIAQQWDECEYEGSGGNIDIGAAIRAAGARLAAGPQEGGAA